MLPPDPPANPIPRRPDPEREAYLVVRWASVFGRPLSIVGAELASEPLMLRGRTDALTNYGVDGWAGVGRAIVRLGISDPGIGGGPVPVGALLGAGNVRVGRVGGSAGHGGPSQFG